MNPARFTRNHLLLLAGVSLIALTGFYLRLAHPPRILDDAYITFRYARNLAQGEGFVYNPGERVLGTTTPLYTLFLAAGAKAFGSQALPSIAVTLNALGDVANILLLFALCRLLGGSPLLSLAAALLYAVSDKSILFSVGGMETSVYIAFLLGGVSLLLRQKPTGACIVFSLACLTRPDALILILLGAFAWCLHHRKIDRTMRRAMLAFLLPVLAWSVFSLLYFGVLLPEPLSAKRIAYSTEFRWWHLAKEFLDHSPTVLFGYMNLDGAYRIASILLHSALFILGGIICAKRHPMGWVIPAYPVAYALTISAGSPFLFQWYIMPAVPFWLLASLLGVSALLHSLSKAFIPSVQASRRFPAAEAATGILLAVALCVQLANFRPVASHLQLKGLWTEREDIYREVALSLKETIPPESRVALPEIGAFGYYHPARVLDTVGLISPEAQDYYPLDKSRYKWNSAIPPLLIQHEKPDFVVAFRDFMRLSLLKSPSFLASYRQIQAFPFRVWASPGPWVYERISRSEMDQEIERTRETRKETQAKDLLNRLDSALLYDLETREQALRILDATFYEELRSLSPWESQYASGVFQDLEWCEESECWYLLDKWGRVFQQDDHHFTLVGRAELTDLDAEAVDLEKTPWGWLVLDSLGGLHSAENQTLPLWMNTPQKPEIPDAVDFELDRVGQGLYILDARGGIHPRGNVRLAKKDRRSLWDHPIARALEVSQDGNHWYIIDGHGGVHFIGSEQGRITSTQPPYWGWDIIRDAKISPTQDCIMLLAGTGSIHCYGSSNTSTASGFPFPEWDYLRAFEYHPIRNIWVGMDSNGVIYQE